MLLPLLVPFAPQVQRPAAGDALAGAAYAYRWRWCGALKLLEREVGLVQREPPIACWLPDFDRIEAAAARIRTAD